jgi:hypothetical protein
MKGSLLGITTKLLAHFIIMKQRKHTMAATKSHAQPRGHGKSALRKRLKLPAISSLLMAQIPRQEPAKGLQGVGNSR